MPVSAITPTPRVTDATPPTIKTGAKTLGSDDFMKLLAVQFQSQDPMKPMEDTAFIAQMAQFSALSQSQSMTAEMAKLSANQALATANSYLGRLVTVKDGQGGDVTGVVARIENSSTGPRLVVGDYTYDLSTVLSVQPGPVTNPSAPSVPSGGS